MMMYSRMMCYCSVLLILVAAPTVGAAQATPVSTNNMIYLNSPHTIDTANFGDRGGSKGTSSGGWSDFVKQSRACRAFSLGAGSTMSGRSAHYWSKIGQGFRVMQGSYGSKSREATIKIIGNYSGRIRAAAAASAHVKIRVVVTEDGTQVAEKQILDRSDALSAWRNISGGIGEEMSVTLQDTHTYCVYLHLETSAEASLIGSAEVDFGKGNFRVGYTIIAINFLPAGKPAGKIPTGKIPTGRKDTKFK